MNAHIKSALLALGLAAGLSATSFALAETPWQQHHPRRAEINARLANQNREIRAERREGKITYAQAQALHAGDHNIRAQENADASHDHSHITKAEQNQLNSEETNIKQGIASH